MSARRSERGFTLIELMVSLGVVMFCISLVMGLFISQQKAFASLDLVRVATEAGRDASLEFETALRRAGWGMDPRYAFNFCGASLGATPCRDSNTGSDSIVFYARNPNYHWDPNGTGTPTGAPICTAYPNGCFIGKAWTVIAVGVGNVTLSMRPNDVIEQGQILQLTLANGTSPPPAGTPTPPGTAPVMVTAAAKAANTTAATANVTVTLTPQGDAYNNTNGVTSSFVNYYAFQIDKFAYSIQTINGNPYLMLDTGLTKQVNGSPVAEVVPVAKNVEDLQLAYVLNTPTSGGTGPDNNANWIVGDSPGVLEEPDPKAQAPNPDYISAALNDGSRFTVNPANIRMVRFEMVIRSYRPDPGPDQTWAGDPFPSLENRAGASPPALGRFRRVTIAGSVATRNLEARNPFVY